MVVTTDVGDPVDVHPKQKDPVGRRLALAARALAYHETVVYSGPLYDRMRIEDGKVVVGFKHVGKGLVVHGPTLTGFSIAGNDGKFVEAQARILGDEVTVSSPQVPRPAAVRYGWANYPAVNLWNKDGLPASPFRTDN
jgi:sialate O-acetylesterase